MADGMKKAVIFDLDGTLTDTIAGIKYCGDQAFGAFGMGPFSEEQYKLFVGDGAANLVRRALAAAGDTAQIRFAEVYERYLEIFRENCMYQVKPYEGVPELIEALKERGVKIAVLSNKPHPETVSVIETFFGAGRFDQIRGQKEGVPIKPDPAGVFAILKALGLKAGETLYLGDTGTDMRTGKSAGAFTVGALWGFRDRAELAQGGADEIIAHPLELLALLERENGTI